MKGSRLINSIKYLTLIAVFTSASTLAKVNYEQVYVSSGYPYADLVQRYDQVRIIYTEFAASDNIECRAEFDKAGTIKQSEPVQASLKKFKKAPLKACLGRVAAKQALAATFE